LRTGCVHHCFQGWDPSSPSGGGLLCPAWPLRRPQLPRPPPPQRARQLRLLRPCACVGASPADTTVSRHGGALAAHDPDELTVPVDSPVVAAFPFLQWVLPPTGGRLALIYSSELQGMCITACNFNLSDSQLVRALRNANLMESGLSIAACSTILHELHDSRLLESVYERETDFWETQSLSKSFSQSIVIGVPAVLDRSV